jgi:GAF domain-containing protein
MDTAPERSYDAITELASFICGSPIALLSLVEKERQWFKAKVGLDVHETPREYSFCAHAIAQGSLMVVEDATTDVRFSNNPFVTGDPNIRFYAGAPLITSDGHGVGSLCVIDRMPRKLTAEQGSALEKLAALVITQLELRRVSRQLAEAATNIKTLSGLVPICAHCKSIRDDENYWQTVEAYVSAHTEARFSHGICPDCVQKHYPEVMTAKKQPAG